MGGPGFLLCFLGGMCYGQKKSLTGRFIMLLAAVTGNRYYGFYFYYGRGAPVDC